MDNIKLADQHLVAMISSVDPDVKCCEIVGSINVETVSSPVMFRMTSLITQTLPNYKLYNIANLVDAAGPNWKALLADSTHAAKDFLPAELMSKFNKIDYSLIHIQQDPVKKYPIVNSPDPLHLGKNICTALEKSDSNYSKRYVKYKGCPMNLGMIKLCWLATGGNTAQLQETKLTMHHFVKDSNSRMNVALALSVLSASV